MKNRKEPETDINFLYCYTNSKGLTSESFSKESNLIH
jgi:hypothetical protein